MWGKNLHRYFTIDKKPFIEMYNTSYVGDLIGNQLYSLESIGTLFTVRATLKRPKRMRTVLIGSYALVAVIFVLNGVTFLLAYGFNGLEILAFDYFRDS